MSTKIKNFVLILAVFFYSTISVADNHTSSQIKWAGFASTGAAFSNSATEYIERITDDGNFDDTRLGLNLSIKIAANMQLAGQILMAGREDEFNAHADWVFQNTM